MTDNNIDSSSVPQGQAEKSWGSMALLSVELTSILEEIIKTANIPESC